MESSHEQSSKPNEDIPWRSVDITPTKEEQIAQTTVKPTRTQTEQTMTTPTTQMTQTTTSGNVTTFTFNGVSFDMVNVKGGIFLMGSSASEAESYEKPTHHEVVESFMIGKTEVTQALWKAVMGTNPSQFKGDYLPVETVTWDDCQKFISRLKDITGKKFRLPTETEWEYAARGGNQNHGYKYSGSNDINSVAWYRDISDNKTHGIATKAPNELGLYDMSGNVWEWTSDKWCDDYNSPRNGGNNGNFYVCRGGSNSNDSSCSRVAFRAGAPSDHGYNDVGLRLALDY
jgi:formylglycine-generating enzyme required for sulfatase activity